MGTTHRKSLMLFVGVYLMVLILACVGMSICTSVMSAVFGGFSSSGIDSHYAEDRFLVAISFLLSSLSLGATPFLFKRGLGPNIPVDLSLILIQLGFFGSLGLSHLLIAVCLWEPVFALTEMAVMLMAGTCVATASVSFLLGRLFRDVPSATELHAAMDRAKNLNGSNGDHPNG